MRQPSFLDSPRKILFWVAMGVITLSGIVSLGAVYQGSQSESWFSIPSLWFFGLVVMPVLLYGMNRFYWIRRDRMRK